MIEAIIKPKQTIVEFELDGEPFVEPKGATDQPLLDDSEIIREFEGHITGFSDLGPWEPWAFKTVPEAYKYLDDRADTERYINAVKDLGYRLLDAGPYNVEHATAETTNNHGKVIERRAVFLIVDERGEQDHAVRDRQVFLRERRGLNKSIEMTGRIVESFER